jgi:hypothetical protein
MNPYKRQLSDAQALEILDDFAAKKMSFTAYYKSLKNPLLSRTSYYLIINRRHYAHLTAVESPGKNQTLN